MTQLLYTATFFWLSTRRVSGLTAIHVLLLVALLEVAINRIAVPMLRPSGGVPPPWHTYLDYAGLFLFYFAGTLAALLLGVRCWRVLGSRGSRRPFDPTGEVPRPAGRAVGVPTPRDSASPIVASILIGGTTLLAAIRPTG